jgi:hypothetical protein
MIGTPTSVAPKLSKRRTNAKLQLRLHRYHSTREAARKLKTAAPSATLHDLTKNRGKVSTRRRLQFFQDQEGLGGVIPSVPGEGHVLFPDTSPAFFLL